MVVDSPWQGGGAGANVRRMVVEKVMWERYPARHGGREWHARTSVTVLGLFGLVVWTIKPPGGRAEFFDLGMWMGQ